MKHKLSKGLGILLSTILSSQAYAASPKKEVKFGVIGDPHGNVQNVAVLSALMKQQLGVDALIIPGDLCKNEPLRTGEKESVPDRQEIYAVLDTAARNSGLQVFVIPGNHETRPDYDSALADVVKRHANIIDMSRVRTYNKDGIQLVSLPGYDTFRIPNRQFIPDNGFFAKPEDIRGLSDIVNGKPGPYVLVAHGPPKTPDGKIGIDTIYSRRNVGSEVTAKEMKDAGIRHGTFGHIHEAGGIAVDSKGDYVSPDIWSAEVRVNAGSADRWEYLDGETKPGMGVMLTVDPKSGKAKYLGVELK